MKKLFFILIIMAVAGCKKNGSSPLKATGYFMSATINGQAWQVTKYGTAYFALYTNTPAGNMLSIMGSDTTRNSSLCRFISINFYSKPTVGTYYFNNNGDVLTAGSVMVTYIYDRGPEQIDKWSTGGHVDITSITDNEIKGDFTCTAVGDANDTTTTTIANGKFDVVNQ